MEMNIMIWAPILFGAVIGWMVAFFIRKYRTHSDNSLSNTAIVFGSGCIFSGLSFFYDKPTGTLVMLYYALGCAIGFFAFWIFQLIVSFAFKSKFTRTFDLYSLFSSCNVEMSEAIQKYSKLEQKAKLLKTGYKQLAAGKTTHEEFEQLIKQIKFTADEWDELLSLDGDYILLSDEIIAYIQAKGLRRLVEQ